MFSNNKSIWKARRCKVMNGSRMGLDAAGELCACHKACGRQAREFKAQHCKFGTLCGVKSHPGAHSPSQRARIPRDPLRESSRKICRASPLQVSWGASEQDCRSPDRMQRVPGKARTARSRVVVTRSDIAKAQETGLQLGSPGDERGGT